LVPKYLSSDRAVTASGNRSGVIGQEAQFCVVTCRNASNSSLVKSCPRNALGYLEQKREQVFKPGCDPESYLYFQCVRGVLRLI